MLSRFVKFKVKSIIHDNINKNLAVILVFEFRKVV